MSVANFFDKAALGASQVLHGFDQTEFRTILAKHHIRICFTREAASKEEAKIILDLLTRLLSRLYPSIEFHCTNDANHEINSKLVTLAKGINPDIETKTKKSSIDLCVDEGDFDINGQAFYLGADQWLGFFSTELPQSCGHSRNPFGTAVAACIGAANVFRYVFRDQLPFSGLDNQVILSAFDYSLNENANQGPALEKLQLNDIVLVGLGAIGNAAIWALQYLDLGGQLTLIDHETVELSNLQRYILCTQDDLLKSKVDVAKDFLGKNKLEVQCVPKRWEEYLQIRNDWQIQTVLVGVDSVQTRIDIQTSLPFRIINAWTQIEQLGISRHDDFINEACLACLYFPKEQIKSLSEEIAENLNMATMEKGVIRTYLAEKKPIDHSLLQLISQANKIPISEISNYEGKQLEVFHSEIVCGGILMKLTGTSTVSHITHVPSAFESALAGVLLAAEMTITTGDLRQNKIPNRSKINLMRPLTKYTTEFSKKHESGRCICQDPVIRSIYKKKWNLKES